MSVKKDSEHSGLYYPVAPDDLDLENAIYIPRRLTRKYKSEFLKEAGLAGAVMSYNVLTQQEASLVNIHKILDTCNTDVLLQMVGRLCLLTSQAGIKSCADDKIQEDVYRNAVVGIAKSGIQIQIQSPDEIDLKYIIAFEPLSLLMLSVIILEYGITTEGINVNENQNPLGHLLALTNDLVYRDNESDDGSSLYVGIMKQSFTALPLFSSKSKFGRKIYRTSKIYENAFERMNEKNRSKFNGYLSTHVGQDFKNLMVLSLPLSAYWLLLDKSNENCLIEPHKVDGDLKFVIQDLCKNLSKDSAYFKTKLKEIREVRGDLFFKTPEAFKLMIQNPLVEIQKGLYSLIAPFMLTRKFELAVEDAFFTMKEESEEPYMLRGPLGHAYEDYIDSNLKKIFPDLNLMTSPYEKSPKLNAKKDELCDFIIDAPPITVIIEAKYKTPPMKAADLSSDSYEEFDKWLYEILLKTPEEAASSKSQRGALWQLDRAAKALKNRETRGYKAEQIIPVVLLSVEIATPHLLQIYIERKSKEMALFEGVEGILPVVTMSTADLEQICSIDFTKFKFTFAELIKEKSLKARHLTWTSFLLALDPPTTDSKEIEEFLEQIIKKVEPLMQVISAK